MTAACQEDCQKASGFLQIFLTEHEKALDESG